MKVFGALLILLGVVALAYGGISYTTHKRSVDMGPLQIERTKHHSIPLPPMLGLAGILVGGAIVLTARTR